MSTPVLIAAPDKFRGSLSAPAVAAAMVAGARSAGWEGRALPLADGGEGTLEALGGANRRTVVTGPVGRPVVAAWRLDGQSAVIEAAAAAGLDLAGGKPKNNPVEATTYGVGELIAAAIAAGAREIIVGVGGSASTDGGLGAISALGGHPFSDLGVSVAVACDVTTTFLDAARVFAPQKGADAAQVRLLAERLASTATHYRVRFGIDVTGMAGGGAAGGLAGGLAALGARLESGFDLVASVAGLEATLGPASVDTDGTSPADCGLEAVATGEGLLDATSLEGKVVGGVVAAARRRKLPVLAIVGGCAPDVAADPLGPGNAVVSLSAAYGTDRSWSEPERLIADVTTAWLNRLGTGGPRLACLRTGRPDQKRAQPSSQGRPPA